MTKKPTKSDIGRLQRMERELYNAEIEQQQKYGDPIPGTKRMTQIKDREVLIKVIDFLTS